MNNTQRLLDYYRDNKQSISDSNTDNIYVMVGSVDNLSASDPKKSAKWKTIKAPTTENVGIKNSTLLQVKWFGYNANKTRKEITANSGLIVDYIDVIISCRREHGNLLLSMLELSNKETPNCICVQKMTQEKSNMKPNGGLKPLEEYIFVGIISQIDMSDSDQVTVLLSVQRSICKLQPESPTGVASGNIVRECIITERYPYKSK